MKNTTVGPRLNILTIFILTPLAIMSVLFIFKIVRELILRKKGPKRIWTFWHDMTKCPNIVKTNFECIRKLYPEWNLTILTNKNIVNFVDNSIIQLMSGFTIPHKTDMYRLYILKKFGGLWIDSSVFLKDTTFINNLYNLCKSQNKISLFETTYAGNNTNFPPLENWFIMSPEPNHYIIDAWYNEFLDAVKMSFAKYKLKLESLKHVNVKHIYDVVGDYLTMHACIQYMIQTNPSILNDVVVHKSEENMFYIQNVLGFDSTLYRDKFINIGYTIPCIKMRGGERDLCAELDAGSNYYKKSG